MIKIINILIILAALVSTLFADSVIDTKGWLESEIRQYVINRNPSENLYDIAVELQSVSTILEELGKGNLTLECRKRGQISGKTLFLADFQSAETSIDFHIVANVQRLEKVLVLKVAVDRNQALSSDDIAEQVMPVNWSSSNNPVHFKQLSGLRTKRAIPQGRVLLDSMVETIPLIKRGEQVNMNVTNNNISISIPVICQAKGGIGDIIKVRDTINGSYFYAEILNPSTVLFKSNKR